MTPTVLAIDPGTEGAIAVLDGDSVILEPMPLNAERKLDVPELVRLLAYYVPRATRVYIELAGIRPHQSPQTTAAQWRSFGRLEGVLATLGASPVIVTAKTWSAQFDHGVTERDKHLRYTAIKKSRREIATRLYPGVDLRKNDQCVVPHEGIVDALLIATWAMKQYNQEREGSHHEQEAEDDA